ncbi:MAG: hypothetical protein Alis3KO_26500 [Aliiglaciecola sp.]
MDLTLLELIGSILMFASAGILGLLIAKYVKLPLSLILVIVGFALSFLIQPLGWDTGIRASNFQDLMMFVLLPILIFESAYSLDLKLLKKYLPNVITLATFGVIVSAIVVAFVLFYGIDHVGFPLIAALITGVVVSATDPVAVVSQLKLLEAPEDLAILIEGESLFNDATAIVMFTILVALATSNEVFSFSGALLKFVIVFLGGIAVGVVLGAFAALLTRWIEITLPHLILLTLVLAYGSLYVGEHFLHVSGIVAVMFAALTFKKMADPILQTFKQEIHHTWESLGFIANVFVFVLLGLVVTIDMFTAMWLAMLLAIAGSLVARFVAVYSSVYLNHLTFGQSIPNNYPPIMVWGGLRGAVTIALVLSLPTEMPYWWTIQSIGFAVVIFSLLVQATTNPFLMRKLKV